MLRPRSLLKSSSKLTILLAFGASSESSATLVCKKKLYACRPKSVPQQIETQRTRRKQRTEPCDPASLERAVRQLLADKISGNQVGIWLLAPEHLRLGTWDLLCAWSQSGGQTIWPRMALHLVHEAAFCVNGLRSQRSLTQKGFELSNGLPFVPTDFAIHEMLGRHTMAEAQALQVALGKIRRASGHFQGRLLGIDPHRIKSCTKTSDAPASFQRQGKGAQNGAVFLLPGLGQCPATLFYPGLCSKNRDSGYSGTAGTQSRDP